MNNNNSNRITIFYKTKKLVIPKETYDKMLALAHAANFEEFQWFTTVDNVNGDTITLGSELYIPKQVITATTVTSGADSCASLINEIPDGVYLTVWCHSHVKMQCTPSSRDYTEIKEFVSEIMLDTDNEVGFRIMLIINQHGDVTAQYHTKEYGVSMEVEIQNHANDEIREWAENVVNSNIVKVPVHYNQYFGSYRNSNLPKGVKKLEDAYNNIFTEKDEELLNRWNL